MLEWMKTADTARARSVRRASMRKAAAVRSRCLPACPPSHISTVQRRVVACVVYSTCTVCDTHRHWAVAKALSAQHTGTATSDPERQRGREGVCRQTKCAISCWRLDLCERCGDTDRGKREGEGRGGGRRLPHRCSPWHRWARPSSADPPIQLHQRPPNAARAQLTTVGQPASREWHPALGKLNRSFLFSLPLFWFIYASVWYISRGPACRCLSHSRKTRMSTCVALLCSNSTHKLFRASALPGCVLRLQPQQGHTPELGLNLSVAAPYWWCETCCSLLFQLHVCVRLCLPWSEPLNSRHSGLCTAVGQGINCTGNDLFSTLACVCLCLCHRLSSVTGRANAHTPTVLINSYVRESKCV